MAIGKRAVEKKLKNVDRLMDLNRKKAFALAFRESSGIARMRLLEEIQSKRESIESSSEDDKTKHGLLSSLEGVLKELSFTDRIVHTHESFLPDIEETYDFLVDNFGIARVIEILSD